MRYLPKSNVLSRRNLIKSAGAAALLAPVLRQLDDAEASTESPRRLIMIFSGNGPMVQVGPAEAAGDGYALSPWYQELERHRDVGFFMSHLATVSAGSSSNAGHDGESQAFDGYGCNDRSVQGPSIHHVIEECMRQENRLPAIGSLVWGNMATTYGRDVFSIGPGQDVAPVDDPSRAWAQVFANFMAPEDDPEAIAKAQAALARRKSILDFAIEDGAKLQTTLGSAGHLLDSHLTGIRDIERRLGDIPIIGGGCTGLDESPSIGGRDNSARDEQSMAFNELIAATLACEFTQLICFQMEPPGGTPYGVPESYGVPGSHDHHHWTHEGDSPDRTRAMEIYTKYHVWQIADLIDRLKTTVDASGNPLIDSTVVHWKTGLGGHPGNDFGHPETCCPEAIFGSGCGTFKTDAYYRGSGPAHGKGDGWEQAGIESAQVLLAMKHYMGCTNETSVGTTENIEPLPELYA